MKTTTEAVVRKHLETFLEKKGVKAIVADYDENARLYGQTGRYQGKKEIGEFFTGFIASLPPGAIERFALTSMHVDGEMAYITWSSGSEIPLGTDTFVVRDGLIVQQTFAMHRS
jgi:hypothetical protein